MTAASVPAPSMFAVFRKRDFSLLWLAQLISTAGSALTDLAALPLRRVPHLHEQHDHGPLRVSVRVTRSQAMGKADRSSARPMT